MAQTFPQPNVNAAFELTTELLLVRHGHSMPVALGADDSDDPPLSERGVAQSEALARRLRTKDVAAVYASDLARARQTAAPIAASRGLEVVTLAELREIDLGTWGRGEFHRRAALRDAEWKAFLDAGRWDAIPGCEGDDRFRARARATVERLLRAHPGRSVVAVTHSGFVNACLAELWSTTRSFLVGLENTSVTIVRAGVDARVVVTHNDCHHLHDPLAWTPRAVSSAP